MQLDGPVSIVIPTYNRLTTLRQVLGSYLAQRKVREILVIDDAGTDATGDLVRAAGASDPRVVYFRSDRRLGLPAARNLGAELATGDYVLWGEDDLLLAPDYAEALLACLERTGASIAGGRALYPLPGETDREAMDRTAAPRADRIDRRRIAFDASAPAEEDLEVPFLHSWTLIRKEVFAAVRYHEGFRGNFFREETDFYLSAGRRGHRIVFCPHTYCVHLPREVKALGGCWADGIWKYKVWSLCNNHRFLERHHGDLRARGLVSRGFWPSMLSFAATELGRAFTYSLRKYLPALHAGLARRLARRGARRKPRGGRERTVSP